jgi:histidine triad (HIT) family protein
MTAPDCVFCDIVSVTADASFVYRDDLVSAFLDILPVTPGHLLVVPNEHLVSLADVPDTLIARVFTVARDLAGALRASDLQADGASQALADGEAAGQEVWHTHVHVIPRFDGDGFSIAADAWSNPPPDRDELDSIAARIRLHSQPR